MEDFYIKFKIISEQNDIKQLNLLYALQDISSRHITHSIYYYLILFNISK